MIFESINYVWLLQDFVFSMVAGFITAIFSQIIGIILYKGKIRLFIRDILTCLFFSVMIYSFIISFANYHILRIYHIIGGLIGFLCFNIKFSKIFHILFERIFKWNKSKILCVLKKINSTISVRRQKKAKSKVEKQKSTTDESLKTDIIYVYNI